MRARLGHGNVIDAAQVVVRVIMGRVEAARRIDVGPAAGDHHRVLLDLQVLRDAPGGDLDQLGELGEGGTRMQVLWRLPVAAARHLGARRDDLLDLGLELGVERHGIRRRDVDGPQGRGEEFLDFLLQLHGFDFNGNSPGGHALKPAGRDGAVRARRAENRRLCRSAVDASRSAIAPRPSGRRAASPR